MSGTVTISVPGQDEELRQLARWLRDEDELRGQAELAQQPILAGHMGAVGDAVSDPGAGQ